MWKSMTYNSIWCQSFHFKTSIYPNLTCISLKWMWMNIDFKWSKSRWFLFVLKIISFYLERLYLAKIWMISASFPWLWLTANCILLANIEGHIDPSLNSAAACTRVKWKRMSLAKGNVKARWVWQTNSVTQCTLLWCQLYDKTWEALSRLVTFMALKVLLNKWTVTVSTRRF